MDYQKEAGESNKKRLDEDSDSIPDTIIACCILCNICIIRGDRYEIDNDDDDDDKDDIECFAFLVERTYLVVTINL